MNDCILWDGPRFKNGYGKCKDGAYAHRRAWSDEHGPIPAGMVVAHSCDNPPCVNVEHLFLTTPKGNTADMVAKGRHGSMRMSKEALAERCRKGWATRRSEGVMP